MNPLQAIEEIALAYESWIRLGSFGTVFALMLGWELLAPRRPLLLSRLTRWSNNLGLFLLNTIALRLLFPVAAVGAALVAREQGWGLFNLVEIPAWVEVVGAVLLLDLVIYWQHWLMHRVPLLWRLHRVHHADLDFDITTGSRFHTLEILLSMLIKWVVILLLGPALLAVLVFEVILSSMAIFNHANISLPAKLDNLVRKLLVTPDMHRVHHSMLWHETNSNYGFNLSLWDRLFKTYIDQPQSGHDDMIIGLSEFRNAAQVDRLPGMLWLPFVNKP